MRVARASAPLRLSVRIRIYRINGFTGLRFARLAVFAVIGKPANPNTDKRPPIADPTATRILKIL